MSPGAGNKLSQERMAERSDHKNSVQKYRDSIKDYLNKNKDSFEKNNKSLNKHLKKFPNSKLLEDINLKIIEHFSKYIGVFLDELNITLSTKNPKETWFPNNIENLEYPKSSEYASFIKISSKSYEDLEIIKSMDALKGSWNQVISKQIEHLRSATTLVKHSESNKLYNLRIDLNNLNKLSKDFDFQDGWDKYTEFIKEYLKFVEDNKPTYRGLTSTESDTSESILSPDTSSPEPTDFGPDHPDAHSLPDSSDSATPTIKPKAKMRKIVVEFKVSDDLMKKERIDNFEVKILPSRFLKTPGWESKWKRMTGGKKMPFNRSHHYTTNKNPFIIPQRFPEGAEVAIQVRAHNTAGWGPRSNKTRIVVGQKEFLPKREPVITSLSPPQGTEGTKDIEITLQGTNLDLVKYLTFRHSEDEGLGIDPEHPSLQQNKKSITFKLNLDKNIGRKNIKLGLYDLYWESKVNGKLDKISKIFNVLPSNSESNTTPDNSTQDSITTPTTNSQSNSPSNISSIDPTTPLSSSDQILDSTTHSNTSNQESNRSSNNSTHDINSNSNQGDNFHHSLQPSNININITNSSTNNNVNTSESNSSSESSSSTKSGSKKTKKSTTNPMGKGEGEVTFNENRLFNDLNDKTTILIENKNVNKSKVKWDAIGTGIKLSETKGVLRQKENINLNISLDMDRINRVISRIDNSNLNEEEKTKKITEYFNKFKVLVRLTHINHYYESFWKNKITANAGYTLSDNLKNKLINLAKTSLNNKKSDQLKLKIIEELEKIKKSQDFKEAIGWLNKLMLRHFKEIKTLLKNDDCFSDLKIFLNQSLDSKGDLGNIEKEYLLQMNIKTYEDFANKIKELLTKKGDEK